MVEGDVGNGPGLEEPREQHATDPITTETLGADEEVGRGAIGVLKPKDQRLTIGYEGPNIGSGLLTAAAHALRADRIGRGRTVDRRQSADVTFVEGDDQEPVFL